VRKWAIYHLDREYAGSLGDPLLGIVEAPDRDAARLAARAAGLSGPSGIWIVLLAEQSKGLEGGVVSSGRS